MKKIDGEQLMRLERVAGLEAVDGIDIAARVLPVTLNQLIQITLAAYYLARDADSRGGLWAVDDDSMTALRKALGQSVDED